EADPSGMQTPAMGGLTPIPILGGQSSADAVSQGRAAPGPEMANPRIPLAQMNFTVVVEIPNNAASTNNRISQLVLPRKQCSVCHNPFIMGGGSFANLPLSYRMGAAMWLGAASPDPTELDSRLADFRGTIEPIMSRVEGAGRVMGGVAG